jgi:hypothetical protein
MMRSLVSNRALAIAGVVASLSLVALATSWVIPATAGAEAEARAAANATISAVTNQWLVLGAEDDSELAALYDGEELKKQRDIRVHIRDLKTQGTDYPGALVLSDIHDLSVSGDLTDTATVTFGAHERLANMKGNKVIDYSESDLLYKVDLRKVGNHWKVTLVTATFDPEGMHP